MVLKSGRAPTHRREPEEVTGAPPPRRRGSAAQPPLPFPPIAALRLLLQPITARFYSGPMAARGAPPPSQSLTAAVLPTNGLPPTSERVYILLDPMASALCQRPANGKRAASDSCPMGAADSPILRSGGWVSPRRRLRNVNYSTWRRRLPGSRPW